MTRTALLPDIRATRRGFSLSELLVASAIALVVMGAVATLLGVFSGALSKSQGTLDLTARMRTAAWQLRQDLAGVTLDVVPGVNPEADEGYFSLIEGPRRDSNAAANTANLEADTDDVLQFTTRAIPGPFASRYNTDTIEAPCAEVGWWLLPAASQTVPGVTLYDLCRRQFVVASFVGKSPFDPGNSLSGAAVASAQQFYDISLRTEAGRLVPNTLGDLGRRENRFVYSTASLRNTVRDGEDVVLSNVISFDVRVFDPQARAQVVSTIVRYPGDPTYVAGTGPAGAYVDLGAGQAAGALSLAPNAKSGLTTVSYDTWTLAYEFNGAGTNGQDDNGDGMPDDSGELVRPPPYTTPLRGIEVRIRCYDASSSQVRQMTIRHTFQRP
ncbi:MAG: prepilin-type N-terminal cleavage/methylation domain-containing protein [Planctomycetota bacterium]|nr:MAG: prepilin-type N-terminal cleavage/methylation domain-containing protein [Planctomycetota bacterium]